MTAPKADEAAGNDDAQVVPADTGSTANPKPKPKPKRTRKATTEDGTSGEPPSGEPPSGDSRDSLLAMIEQLAPQDA